ncbi:MAG: LysR substrate-binding domain-containing protein [Kocuria sp.]|nr:LysR substrate-binding domain-containing protein [Kocuria sp.]
MTDTPSGGSTEPDDAVPAADAPERPDVLGPPRDGLTVGFVPGIMPDKWFSRWDERFGNITPLTRLALNEGAGVEALRSSAAHMALLRPDDEHGRPDATEFHAVRLFDEKPVVVLPVDHVLTLLDEVPVEELAEEFMMQDPTSIPEWAEASSRYRAQNPRRLPSMRDTSDGIELVAAGIGLMIVPMSVARHHHRKDLTYRVVEDMPPRPVDLVWLRDDRGNRAPEDEEILQEFVGIARGRKASSSRGASSTAENASRQSGRKKERPAPVRGKPGRAPSGRTSSRKNRSGTTSRTSSRAKKR